MLTSAVPQTVGETMEPSVLEEAWQQALQRAVDSVPGSPLPSGTMRQVSSYTSLSVHLFKKVPAACCCQRAQLSHAIWHYAAGEQLHIKVRRPLKWPCSVLPTACPALHCQLAPCGR